MYRYLNGKRDIPDNLLNRMLEYVDRNELYEILSAGEKLRVLGFIKDDGSIDYSTAVEFSKVVFQD